MTRIGRSAAPAAAVTAPIPVLPTPPQAVPLGAPPASAHPDARASAESPPGPADVDVLLERALRSDHHVAVRRRIFRQLLESLLYEGRLTARPHTVAGSDGSTDESTDDGTDDGTESGPDHTAGWFAVDGRDAAGAPVRYRFRLRHRYGFDRLRLGREPVLRRDEHAAETEADSLTRFLLDTRDALGAADDRLAGFAHELTETLLKDTVAQYVHAERGTRLRGASFGELEGRVIDGHPYHPAYKSRLGFDLDDHLAYGPEFARPIRPIWLAVRRELAAVSTVDDIGEAALRAYLGDAAAAFTERIAERGADPAAFTLLPVHPWQWREHVRHSHARWLRDGDLLVLGPDPRPHVAQQSIRTLECPSRPEQPYLKLALSMVNTSTSRVLAPHTVRNAPRITGWLRRVVASDPYLHDELRPVLLGEIAGIAVDPPPLDDLVRVDTDGVLSCI